MNYKSMFLLTALALQVQFSLSAVTWEDIPDTIKISIFRKLDISSRGKMSMVSKKHNMLVSTNTVWQDDLPDEDMWEAIDKTRFFKDFVKRNKINPLYFTIFNKTGKGKIDLVVTCFSIKPQLSFVKPKNNLFLEAKFTKKDYWSQMKARINDLDELFENTFQVPNSYFQISVGGQVFDNNIQPYNSVEVYYSENAEAGKRKLDLKVTPLNSAK